MLVLSRKLGERLALALPDGRVVWLTVVEVVRHDRVRLGIDAPPDVKIDREERLARPKAGEPCAAPQ